MKSYLLKMLFGFAVICVAAVSFVFDFPSISDATSFLNTWVLPLAKCVVVLYCGALMTDCTINFFCDRFKRHK